MKGMDVFSGLTWGNLSRYRIRHDQTINKEKAAALDGRIRQMLEANRNYDWAIKALDFCNHETSTVTKEVSQYSREFPRLRDIQDAALALIQQRKDQEMEAARQAAQKADDTIVFLSAATRSSYWCDEVKKYDDEVRALPRQIRLLMTKLNLLQRLVDEMVLLRKTDEIEGKIRKLLESSKKDASWLKEAEVYATAKPKDDSIRLVQDKDLLEKLKFEYWRVVRAPITKNYNDILNQIDRGQWKQDAVRSQFHSLDNNLKNIGFRVSDYIDQFQSRWQEAKDLVLKEEHRLEEEEKARKREAQIREHKADLKRYLDCLENIEKGKAKQQSVRDAFTHLDKTVKKLNYNPEEYQPGFRSRWSSAAQVVAREQKIADDLAEKARQEAKERALQELQIARAQLAEQERRGYYQSFAVFALSLLLCMGLTFLGVKFASVLDAWWAAPCMIAFGALFYIHLVRVDEDNIYEFPHIVIQVLFYAASVLFLLFFDHRVFSMIVSVALVALLFNLYPRTIDSDMELSVRWIKIGCIIAAAVVLLGGLGYLFPHLVGQSKGNAAWLCPALILAVTGLSSFAIWANSSSASKLWGGVLCALALGLAILTRAFDIFVELQGRDAVTFMTFLGIASILVVPIVFFCRKDQY